ncbi:MAG TPA: sialate O-acetylesterase [Planctomycetota bacterium]
MILLALLLAQDVGPKETFHVYLLLGQSNMAGRGKVEKEDATPHPRVFALTKDGAWAPAVEPLHWDKPAAGVGPGFAFGKAMADADPKIRIGLVPCAAGGSPIEAWRPGAFHDQTKSHPWDDTVTRAKAALAKGTLKGFLWHQGESNKAEGHADKLVDLVKRLRAEFGNVPFVCGELGRFKETYAPMNAVLGDVAKRVERSACVSSDGLKDKGDTTHFDAPGARELGRRYAAAMIRLKP